MAARSTGVFPREKFDLDAALAVPLTASNAPFLLTSVLTIRVVVIGAAGIDNAGTNKVTVTVGGQSVVFKAQDLDANGVGIAHIRGTLCDINNQIQYVLGGTATVRGVYLDAVDC